MRLTPLLLVLACTTLPLPVVAEPPLVAGLKPAQRPLGAPIVVHFEQSDAWRAGALETTRPHIGYETALLFIGETIQLRMNPEFPQLCTRLGLSRYWRETNAWPDYAAEAPYDFKAACGV